jgi:hypothetical protein
LSVPLSCFRIFRMHYIIEQREYGGIHGPPFLHAIKMCAWQANEIWRFYTTHHVIRNS